MGRGRAPHILIISDRLADVSTPHFRFIKTPHVSASTPAHPSRPIVDTVAHLRIGTEGQLDVGERGILWSGEYSRDGV